MIHSICNSFKLECMKGVHNFAVTGGDSFRIALYQDNVPLGPLTEVYDPKGETRGRGYEEGGMLLINVTPVSIGRTVYTSFHSPVIWSFGTFSARGALIYNVTKGNKAVAVLDFGKLHTTAGSVFKVHLPIDEHFKSPFDSMPVGSLVIVL